MMNGLDSAVNSCKVLINNHSYIEHKRQFHSKSEAKPVETMVERFVQSLANANDSGSFDTSLEVKVIEHPKRKRSKCVTELDREDLLKFVMELEARRTACSSNADAKFKAQRDDVYVEYLDTDSDFGSTDQEYFDDDCENENTEADRSTFVEPRTPENPKHPYEITEDDLRERLTAKKRSHDDRGCRASRLLTFLSSASKSIKNLRSASCNNSRNSSPVPQRSKHFERGYRHITSNSDTEDDGISTSSQLTSRNISPDSSFDLHPPILPTFKVTPPRDQRPRGSFGQFMRSSLRAKRASVLRRSISNPDNLTMDAILNEGSMKTAATTENKTEFVDAKNSTVRRGLGAAMIRNLDVLCSRAFPTTGSSPFRRWGQSSFRSARIPETRTSLARRPSSLAASDNDVYTKSIDDYNNHDLDSHRSQSEELTQSSSEKNAKENNSVIAWGQSFEKLLDDPAGLHTFAEFLKKEFSAENIYFWTACERYKQIVSDEERAALAMNIFTKHLANGAPEPVNVDSQARNIAEENLRAADRNLFAPAQKQIFNLMKFDSYQRFIRSELYKKCIEAEAKNQPLPYPADQLDEVLITNLSHFAGHSKLKKSASNAEDRRRKSILPWHRKARCKSRDRADSDSQNNSKTPNSKSSGNTLKPYTTNSTSDIHSSRSSLSSFDAATAFANGSDELRTSLCRVILCNGATTIVQTRPNETIRQLVERLLEKRGIQYKFFDVLISGKASKPLELELPSTELAGKEVEIEQRVAFKLDLPDPKVISVKSKPKKALGDVLKPILQKYNYRIDEVQVLIRETHEPLTMDLPVTVADGLRLQVVLLNLDGWQQNHMQHQQQTQQQQNRPSHAPTYQNSSNLQLPRVLPHPIKIDRPANQQVTLDEITNRVFNELLQGKANAHANPQPQSTRTFDQNSLKSDDCASETSSIFERLRRRESSSAGIKMARPRKIILPKSSTAGSEDGLSTTTQATTGSDLSGAGIKKPLIAKWKTGVKLQVTGHRAEKHEEFLEGLKRAQRARLEDQRGTEINSELPDFLKNKENLNAISKLRKTNQLSNELPISSKPNDPIPSARSSLDSAPGMLTPRTDRPQPAPRFSITKSNTCASIFPTKSSQYNGNYRPDPMNTSTCSSNSNNISPTRSTASNDSNIDFESTESKAPPPPLPPKPKILPMKPSNWGQSPQSANSSPNNAQVIDSSVSAVARRHLNLNTDHHHQSSHNVYLDQPTSSFV